MHRAHWFLAPGPCPFVMTANLRALEPSCTPQGSPSAEPSANLHGKPAKTFVDHADCEVMTRVEATPATGNTDPDWGGSPTRECGAPVAVTLVEAPACHLCADAKSTLAVLGQRYPMTIQ